MPAVPGHRPQCHELFGDRRVDLEFWMNIQEQPVLLRERIARPADRARDPSSRWRRRIQAVDDRFRSLGIIGRANREWRISNQLSQFG